MAIGSEVFGSCVGGIDVSVGMENRGVWLRVELLEIYCGRQSGLGLAVEVGDGARYWRAF